MLQLPTKKAPLAPTAPAVHEIRESRRCAQAHKQSLIYYRRVSFDCCSYPCSCPCCCCFPAATAAAPLLLLLLLLLLPPSAAAAAAAPCCCPCLPLLLLLMLLLLQPHCHRCFILAAAPVNAATAISPNSDSQYIFRI